jgi:hypothetical protein
MRDAEQVRHWLRAEHRGLLGTAQLLAGGRGAAAELLAVATSRVLRRQGAARLSAGAVRGEMARIAAGGGARPRQVVDTGSLGDVDDDLGPLAAALDDLPPALRVVAVLRIADDVEVDDVARALAVPPAQVHAAEREALDRLAPAAGNAVHLPAALEALAAVLPDGAAADSMADAVLARRRRRRRTAAAAAAALLVGVPLAVTGSDRPSAPAPTAEIRTGDGRGERVDVFAGPPRGSLAADAGFVRAARRVPWHTGNDPPVAARRVVYAEDTRAGRVALVLADTRAGLDGAWLLGPPGAPPGELAALVPERIGRTRPVAVLVEGADAAAVVVVAAPGDAVEFSPRLRSEQTGGLVRRWRAVPVRDGVATVEVADRTAGLAAAVRVVRNGRVAARPVVAGPAGQVEDPAPLRREPLRPGTAPADPVLLGEAAARIARPFGVDPAALSSNLLWSAELTRTGGLGSVVVLVARVPGNAHVVLPLGRLGSARGGLAVPCGPTSFPAEVVAPLVTVATVCSVSDGADSGPDRTWLVVTAPPDAVSAEVLDADGGVLDVLQLEHGGSMTRTPEGASQVRVADAEHRTWAVVPVIPSTEAPFGDYGTD